ncbi:MAG: trimeric autotransporter adhesin, partial [Actinomycetota bacterium]|nr:trimeric autotransporter adhesin [Actinomycetota bacterium]
MPRASAPCALRPRRWLALAAAPLAVLAGVAGVSSPPAAAETSATTAWRDGAFRLDAAGVVSRSDIVLGRPNLNPTASMPLGNGSLAAAAWAANGFTAQLNRSDTMPDRKSPGQVTIPGLSVISHAADFTGRLDLTDGVLEESGGGMSMKAWVSSAKDDLIIDVTGADRDVAQTASINLWSGRKPTAAVSGRVGTLAETWVDQGQAGASGTTFGSLAALTAGGEHVSAAVVSPTQVQVSFKPHPDGSFRVVVGSPAWTGGDAAATARSLLGNDATAPSPALLAGQHTWWNHFWTRSGLIEMSSADGNAA